MTAIAMAAPVLCLDRPTGLAWPGLGWAAGDEACDDSSRSAAIAALPVNAQVTVRAVWGPGFRA